MITTIQRVSTLHPTTSWTRCLPVWSGWTCYCHGGGGHRKKFRPNGWVSVPALYVAFDVLWSTMFNRKAWENQEKKCVFTPDQTVRWTQGNNDYEAYIIWTERFNDHMPNNLTCYWLLLVTLDLVNHYCILYELWSSLGYSICSLLPKSFGWLVNDQ